MKLFPSFLGHRKAIFAELLSSSFHPVGAQATGGTFQPIVKRSQLGVPAPKQTIAIEALGADDANVAAPALHMHVRLVPDKIKQAIQPAVG